MKTTLLICHFFSVIFLMSPSSCQPEYANDTRIFVEGKVVPALSASSGIKLYAEDILISETRTDAAGNFKLGGPGTTRGKVLSFEKKIKTFTSSDPDCRLGSDSLNIVLPANKSYFNFPLITFKP